MRGKPPASSWRSGSARLQLLILGRLGDDSGGCVSSPVVSVAALAATPGDGGGRGAGGVAAATAAGAAARACAGAISRSASAVRDRTTSSAWVAGNDDADSPAAAKKRHTPRQGLVNDACGRTRANSIRSSFHDITSHTCEIIARRTFWPGWRCFGPLGMPAISKRDLRHRERRVAGGTRGVDEVVVIPTTIAISCTH